MSRIRRVLPGLLALLLALSAVLGGCASPMDSSQENVIYVYYLNQEEDALVSASYIPNLQQSKDLVEELRAELCKTPASESSECLLPENVVMEIISVEDRTLTLRFPESYYEMDKTREVLVRAGIVRTFVQIEGIDRVQFYIGEAPLADADGNPVGLMRRETFVDNSAQQLNNYERNAVRLFFANEKGDKLVEEPRAIYHSSSQPLEWAVVSRLIEGPKTAGSFATLPTDTEILSVSTANEVCYVNLSRSFLNSTLTVSEEIPVYSIVNSLVSSCNVKQVQIAIEGDIKVTFRDSIRLDQLFEANEALVEKTSS